MKSIVTFMALSLILSACGSPDTKQEVKPDVKPPVKTAEAKIPAPTVVEKPKLDPALNGKKFYKKCIACHGNTGDGIPRSFPPLNKGIDALATSPEGRAYLVLVITNGLRGTLDTANGSFKGVMVRQAGGKSSADIADVLNYILVNFYPDGNTKPFTTEEVQEINESNGRVNPSDVMGFRPEGH